MTNCPDSQHVKDLVACLPNVAGGNLLSFAQPASIRRA
jgi:hypothetical protein